MVADADGLLDAGDTDVTIYSWDNRDRLVRVTDYAAEGGAATQVVNYRYDAENRLIGETVDPDGDGPLAARQTVFAHDGSQIALQFDKDGPGAVEAADLSHRYLYGPAIDQVLADEHLSPLPPGEGFDLSNPGQVVWPLADNLNTVRDLAVRDAETGVTTVVNHRTFDAYGNLKTETNAAVDCLFAFTGRPLDKVTGLQNNLNRWYDAKTGCWMSKDTAAITAADLNLSRYSYNSPTNTSDPSGTHWCMPIDQTSEEEIGLETFGAKLRRLIEKSQDSYDARYESLEREYQRKKEMFDKGKPFYFDNEYEEVRLAQDTLSPEEFRRWKDKFDNPNVDELRPTYGSEEEAHAAAIVEEMHSGSGLSATFGPTGMAWDGLNFLGGLTEGGAPGIPRGKFEIVETGEAALRRPYIREGVINTVKSRQQKTADGRMIDPFSLRPIENPELAHKQGNEYWREVTRAYELGLSQKEFNERMNNPDLYHFQDRSTNRTHQYELAVSNLNRNR